MHTLAHRKQQLDGHSLTCRLLVALASDRFAQQLWCACVWFASACVEHAHPRAVERQTMTNIQTVTALALLSSSDPWCPAQRAIQRRAPGTAALAEPQRTIPRTLHRSRRRRAVGPALPQHWLCCHAYVPAFSAFAGPTPPHLFCAHFQFGERQSWP